MASGFRRVRPRRGRGDYSAAPRGDSAATKNSRTDRLRHDGGHGSCGSFLVEPSDIELENKLKELDYIK